MGFFDKLFESPYEREQREKREFQQACERAWNNALFGVLDENKKSCERYSKLFPLGYKHVEQKFAYERTPQKENSIVCAVEDMAKYEMELLTSSAEASRLIADCYGYPVVNDRPVFTQKVFQATSARIKIDNLCERVNKERRLKEEIERERFERIYNLPYLGDLSIFGNRDKYDGLSYDYKTVEAPIIKELRLKKAEEDYEAWRREEIAKEKSEKQSRTTKEYSSQCNVSKEQRVYTKSTTQSTSSKSATQSSSQYSTQSSTRKSSVESVTKTREKLLAEGVYEEARKNYMKAIESREWKKMRAAVLNRDNHTCQKCGCKHDLRVHHKYYVMGHAIWDYPSSAFETLCEDCHTEFHSENSVDVYDRIPSLGSQYKRIKLQKCPRCNGHGYIPKYHYVEHGICFLCWGSGYRELFSGPQIVSVIDSKN